MDYGTPSCSYEVAADTVIDRVARDSLIGGSPADAIALFLLAGNYDKAVEVNMIGFVELVKHEMLWRYIQKKFCGVGDMDILRKCMMIEVVDEMKRRCEGRSMVGSRPLPPGRQLR